MHRSRHAGLSWAMAPRLCRASTIEQSSIGLAQISHHKNYSREPRSGKLHKMANPFSHVQTICKNVPNIQGEDITCMTHWQNEQGRLEHSKILQPLRFRCWVAAPLLRPYTSIRPSSVPNFITSSAHAVVQSLSSNCQKISDNIGDADRVRVLRYMLKRGVIRSACSSDKMYTFLLESGYLLS